MPGAIRAMSTSLLDLVIVRFVTAAFAIGITTASGESSFVVKSSQLQDSRYISAFSLDILIKSYFHKS